MHRNEVVGCEISLVTKDEGTYKDEYINHKLIQHAPNRRQSYPGQQSFPQQQKTVMAPPSQIEDHYR